MLRAKTFSSAVRFSGWTAFLVLWFGGLLSLFGSELANFSIGIWVIGETHAVSQFAILMFVTFVPSAALSLVSGSVVDRFDRRVVFILSDAVAAALVLCLYVLAQADMLRLWHVYVIAGLRSALTAFQIPALQALTIMLVGEKQVDRANGMAQLNEVLVLVAAPLAGGLLYKQIGITGAVLIDLITFGFALVGGAALFFAEMSEKAKEEKSGKSTLGADIVAGWRYVVGVPGLVALLIFYGVVSLMRGLVMALFVPLALSFTTPQALGIMTSIAVIGGVVGAGVLMGQGQVKRRARWIILLSFVMGIAMIIGGIRPLIVPITIAGFVFWLTFMIIHSLQLSIWQTVVPNEMLGRALSIRQVFTWTFLSAGVLLAGPLADSVFEPMMSSSDATSFLATVFHIGIGRGIGVLFVLAGIVILITSLIASNTKALRRLDEVIQESSG